MFIILPPGPEQIWSGSSISFNGAHKTFEPVRPYAIWYEVEDGNSSLIAIFWIPPSDSECGVEYFRLWNDLNWIGGESVAVFNIPVFKKKYYFFGISL